MDMDENMRLIHCKCDHERLPYIQGVHFFVTDLTTVRFFYYIGKVSTKVYVAPDTKFRDNIYI